jgi:hypothetical protein
MITALTARPAILHAQEDETLTIDPSADDDPGEANWEPAAAPDPDSSSGQVLELPQTAVAEGDDSAPPAGSIAADDSRSNAPADNSGDLTEYASEGASRRDHCSETPGWIRSLHLWRSHI